jgi:hypothetical protein
MSAKATLDPDRKILHEPEVVPAAIGRPGWTVVRGGRDHRGPFQEWVGANFPSYQEAEAAAWLWESKEPTTEGRAFV